VANGTHYTQSKESGGLYFRWKCPELFQTACDVFKGSPVLEFTPTVFKECGGKPFTYYTFEV
jgi:hypothetical protein